MLSRNNLKVKWEKAKVICKEVEFLGCRISGEGKKAGKAANNLHKIPAPRSKGDLKKLLGRLGYFRNFVPNYALKIAPIQAMLRKDRRFVWSKEFTVIMREIANEITNTQLAFPKNGTLTIECDASKFAVGAVLKSNGELVKCYSEILGESQTRWSSFEKELYAVRQALRSFERLIGCKTIVVCTDNEAVAKFLKGGGELGEKPIRIREWVSDLLSRDFTVKWLKGNDNVHADSLSRLAETKIELKNELQVEAMTRSKDKTVKSKRSTDTKDKEIRNIRKNREVKGPAIQNNPSNNNEETQSESVNRDEIPQMLKKAHLAHAGIGAMLLNLKEHSWKGKINDVKNYVEQCFYCKTKRAPKRNVLKGLKADDIAEIICMDSFKFEDSWYAIAVDYISGFIQVVPTESANAKASRSCLIRMMSVLGKPHKVLTDNGTEFKGDFDEFLAEMDVKHLRTSVNHPQSNMAERKIQEVKKLLSIQNLEHESVDIDQACMLMNQQRSKSSGLSPAEMINGASGLGVIQHSEKRLFSVEERRRYIQNVLTIRERRRNKENQKLDNRDFKENDLVWYFKDKSLRLGVVTEKLHHNTYWVEIEGVKRKVSGDLLLEVGEHQNT